MNFLLKHPQLCANTVVLPLFAAWVAHVNAWGLLGYAALGSLPVYALSAVLLRREARRHA